MNVRRPHARMLMYAVCTWLACATGGAGCAHFPPWRRAAPTAPRQTPPAETSAEAAPDSALPAVAAPAPDKPVKQKPLKKPVEPAPSDSLPTPAEPAPGNSPAERVISVDLPPAEKAQLIDTTQRELEQTAALVRSVEAGRLSPAEVEKLRSIQTLVQASREATERSEIQEAAILAHKAWILAAEMPEH